jgi:hypothetical protein
LKPVLAAAILGAGGGLRSFAPPAALTAHGRGLFPGPGRFVVFGAAAGELIADKQPDMPSRWSPRGLSFRLGFSAMGGHDLAGAGGAAVAAGAALITARAGSFLRGQITDRPAALAAAMLEDALSYTLVGLATKNTPAPPHPS